MSYRNPDKEWWKDLIKALKSCYDVNLIFLTDRAAYVQTGYRDDRSESYCMWSICDNGGELNVEKVNFDETMRSIPYSHSMLGISQVDPGTMAYRVAMVIASKTIDYDLYTPELVLL